VVQWVIGTQFEAHNNLPGVEIVAKSKYYILGQLAGQLVNWDEPHMNGLPQELVEVGQEYLTNREVCDVLGIRSIAEDTPECDNLLEEFFQGARDTQK
jgi:hypothetical protein